jgi:hypothetical protein
MFSYCVERPLVAPIEDRWAEFLFYAPLPMAVTFIVLYRSCWHWEIKGVARTCVLLLLSWSILVGELFAIGVMLCVGWFCLNAVSGGFHP